MGVECDHFDAVAFYAGLGLLNIGPFKLLCAPANPADKGVRYQMGLRGEVGCEAQGSLMNGATELLKHCYKITSFGMTMF